MLRRSAMAVMLVIATGCAEPLPRYSRVEDLRVLAVKAMPPEVLLRSPQAFDVHFEALVFDPRGGEVSYTWSFCPVESGLACRDYPTIRDEAPGELRPALDAMRALGSSGTALPLDQVLPTPDFYWWGRRGMWRYALDNFDVTAPADLYLYHFQDSLLGAGLGAWPSAILEVSKPGEAPLLAQKRMVLGFEDPRGMAGPIAEQYGYTICPAGQTPDDVPGCLLIRDRVPNHNPVFARVQIAEGRSALGEFADIEIGQPGDVSGVVVVRAGESVRIRPAFTADSFEPFQRIELDLASEQLLVEDAVEEISVSWFCSEGSLQDELTWPKFTKSLDTVYTAPQDRPSATDGRVTVWMIARDQRGGEEWMSVELLVQP